MATDCRRAEWYNKLMKHKNIFLVGGAGFLGYHASLEFVRRGANVTILAMPDEAVASDLASQVRVERANIDQLDDYGLGLMLRGQDVLVYAAGPDDRVELPAGVRAAEFFNEHLVNRTERVLSVARESGVKKVVIYGSYFAYINNRGLCGVKRGQLERHPYIQARVEQTRRSFALGGETFSVSVLNIPYVFGVTPGRMPIWKRVFIERYAKQPKIIYGTGGTTVTTPAKIALATVQAVELAGHGEELAVGSVNMKFKPMIERLLAAAKINKPVANLPTWLQGLFMRMAWRQEKAAGRDSGLDLRYLAGDILGRDFYVDYEATDRRLDMVGFQDDVEAAIDETGRMIKTGTS